MAPVIAPTFDSARIAATVKAIQRGEIGYAEFLHRIMGAGRAHYEVYIRGRKAIYFGRDGAFMLSRFRNQQGKGRAVPRFVVPALVLT